MSELSDQLREWVGEMIRLTNTLLRDAGEIELAQGGCRVLSQGDHCDCGLCVRDNEIARLQAIVDKPPTMWADEIEAARKELMLMLLSGGDAASHLSHIIKALRFAEAEAREADEAAKADA